MPCEVMKLKCRWIESISFIFAAKTELCFLGILICLTRRSRLYSRCIVGLLTMFTRWEHWVVVSNMFYFHPYLGKIPILTNIFQMGWIKPPTRNTLHTSLLKAERLPHLDLEDWCKIHEGCLQYNGVWHTSKNLWGFCTIGPLFLL